MLSILLLKTESFFLVSCHLSRVLYLSPDYYI